MGECETHESASKTDAPTSPASPVAASITLPVEALVAEQLLPLVGKASVELSLLGTISYVSTAEGQQRVSITLKQQPTMRVDLL